MQGFHVVSYAGTFSLIYYDAENDDVMQPGYFNPAWERTKPKDLIIVSITGPQTQFYTVVKSDRYGVEVEPVSIRHEKPPAKTEAKSNPEKNETEYTIKHQGFGRWDVLDASGIPINAKPLSKDDAKKVAQDLNSDAEQRARINQTS